MPERLICNKKTGYSTNLQFVTFTSGLCWAFKNGHNYYIFRKKTGQFNDRPLAGLILYLKGIRQAIFFMKVTLPNWRLCCPWLAARFLN